VSVWLELIVAGGIVVLSGYLLARVGERLGEVMGWGRTWVGLLLLSFSTSLPELFTSISSAGILKQPDLALGNNLGSVSFNLFIIALLDFMERGSFTHRLDPSLVLSSSFLIFFVFLFLVFLLLPVHGGFLGVGWDTFSVFLIYILALRVIFLHQHRERSKEKRKSLPGKGRLWVYYFLLGGVIFLSGVWLARTGERISQVTGLSRTFVGTLFLAMITSLPELSTTISCVRLGLPSMAVGNILGANLQNLVIPFFSDIVYRRGYILSAVSSSHLVTLLMGGLLTTVLLIGMTYRSRKVFLRMGWDGILIALIYLGGMYILFLNPFK